METSSHAIMIHCAQVELKNMLKNLIVCLLCLAVHLAKCPVCGAMITRSACKIHLFKCFTPLVLVPERLNYYKVMETLQSAVGHPFPTQQPFNHRQTLGTVP